MKNNEENKAVSGGISPFEMMKDRFRRDPMAIAGLLGVLIMFSIAAAAPLIANGRPLIISMDGSISLPALKYVFAPDSSEILVEKIFNFCLVFIPPAIVITLLSRYMKFSLWAFAVLFFLCLAPFVLVKGKLEKADWRAKAESLGKGEFAIFAPVKYGPFENVAEPFSYPSPAHLFGTDQNGRDVLSRMIYGARVSLAVGILSILMTLVIGIIIGMIAGYFGGTWDIVIMRIVEIVICFPRFLLLLILMVIIMDRNKNYHQSIILVICVIGLTAWTELCRIVRGEVFKQRALAYIKSCQCLGIPAWRIMMFHLLPNVMGPVLVTFTFGVADAVLAESSLSFLGFGVQPPTASWGELLRESLSNPLQHWHLTLWPGIAIFITVVSFNFIGEGLKKAFEPVE